MQAELFIEWLKTERTRRGLTQRDLAELSGVHYSTIAQVEQGSRAPSAEFVVKIGEAFECTPKETMNHLFQVGVRKNPVDLGDAEDSKLIADFLRITRGKPKRAIKSALIGFEQILISESRYAKE